MIENNGGKFGRHIMSRNKKKNYSILTINKTENQKLTTQNPGHTHISFF